MTTSFFERFESETVYSPEVVEEYHNRGYWANLSLGDYLELHAGERDDEPAVIDDGTSLTWGELRRRADAIAAGLRFTGVTPGSRVMFQVSDRVEWFALRLGVHRAGAIAVPVYPRFGVQDVANVLERTEPTVFVSDRPCTGEFGDTIRELTETVEPLAHLVSVDGEDGGTLSLDELAGDPDGFEPEHLDPDYPDCLGLSSGTTGRPKIYYVVQNTYLNTARDVMGRCSVLEYDTVLSLPPVQQAFGHILSTYLTLVSGATVVVTASNAPADQWALIEEHEPTVLGAIPTQSAKLKHHGDPGAGSMATVRSILHGGAPLPTEVAEWEEAQGATVVNGYGAGDGAWATTARPMDPPETRFTTVGPRNESIQLKIVDERGEAVPGAEVGEVLMRGGGCGFGYFGDRRRTEEVFAVGRPYEGWFHSKDAGFIDDDGNLHVVGRMDDMIIRGGQNVYPAEIEDVLVEHDGIAEAAVVGVPDEDLGERVGAFVVEASGATVSHEDVERWFESKGMSRFTWPELYVTRESLPRSPGGKIDKSALLEGLE